jgi:hypothetical protein
MIFGVVGPLFNTLILRAQDMFQRIHGGNTTKWVLVGGFLGGACGILGVIEPNAAGGGFGLIPIAAAGNFSVGLLLFMFISRVVTTVLCFSSGAPGGIFARCWRWELYWERRLGWRQLPGSRRIIWMQGRLPLPGWGRCWPRLCVRR